MTLTHLQQLEAEAIHIFREVVAEFENPVMLYSIGKDSSVLLHLARKAFAPGKIPFPLLHIDTTWKFKEMIAFRDHLAKELELDLRVHTNQEGLAQGINPFDSGSAVNTDIMKHCRAGDNQIVAPFFLPKLLGVFGHLTGMFDSPDIAIKVDFHSDQ